ncbi:phenoxybenzoate dioxygenase beta subunit [Striga asiatica]|uniref:Phenoxybenzoate dioxygenase beta subunit n=1 Tax=Striga asiatica TaxID=4170 RepID=A0A5A7PPS6_STRAF|nr:phenoxybenzoate dioxygenase beta subunit [Striga asiatica]
MPLRRTLRPPPPPSWQTATPEREVYDCSLKIEIEALPLGGRLADLSRARAQSMSFGLSARPIGKFEQVLPGKGGEELRSEIEHMVAMADKAEKLHYELADAEKRAMAVDLGLNLNSGIDLRND